MIRRKKEGGRIGMKLEARGEGRRRSRREGEDGKKKGEDGRRSRSQVPRGDSKLVGPAFAISSLLSCFSYPLPLPPPVSRPPLPTLVSPPLPLSSSFRPPSAPSHPPPRLVQLQELLPLPSAMAWEQLVSI
eukprot:746162-Hanusia_phi.AAC.2